ncbi:MAG: M14 family metallopeptidase, partial [Gemmatimonadota bacterium]
MKWSAGPSVRALAATVVIVALAGPVPQAVAQQAESPSATHPAAHQSNLPTPESVLGFPVGTDFKLATYEQSIAYFKALAAASDRLELLDVGTTSFGRTWYLAVISSPDNLAKLEYFRAIAQRLAHPEGLTDDSAHALAREGRAFVDISGGLHASEVAGAQHTIALAYDLLSRADEPAVKEILDNDVLFLWPSLNPDGQDIVVKWYRENVGTPYEAAPLYTLWEKYVGHDNNRDAYMLNTIESRVITRTWRHWEPQIIHVHHQSSPFPTRIWLPPFSEPVSPDVNPLMAREVNTIGMTMAQELESHGQPGATSMGLAFDAWYPGYVDYLPMLKNTVAYWTETAGYRYATPYFYTLRDFPQNMRDLRARSLYSSPWKGGWWRLKDAVDYMMTASEAALEYAAKYRAEILYNKYQAGRDAIAEFKAQPPYAYVVPQKQRDPMAAVALLKRLAFNGIRVDQLSKPVAMDGMTYPAGTWVIPMDQEFAELSKAVLVVQHYPDLRQYPEGPPAQPYDAAGWTLGYQLGVQVVTVHSPLSDSVQAAMHPVHGQPVDWHTAK